MQAISTRTWLMGIVALLTLVIGVGAATAKPPDNWAALHRPLQLPTVSGSSCPINMKSAQIGRGVWNGTGPAYLESVGPDQQPGVIDISGSAPDGSGWRGQKTPWLVPEKYTGPVLVRARRLDASGAPVLAKVYGQHLQELRFASGVSNGTRDRSSGFHGSYRFLAASSLFRESGCYAFQIDGISFSAVIVMRVVG